MNTIRLSNENQTRYGNKEPGETTKKRLSQANLLDRGLEGAPRAMNLSKKELKELLMYIEENF
jgi:hypothetical protein